MCFISVLAAANKANVSILDALPHLAGMLMVMVVLAVLWGVCAFTAKMLQIFAPEPKAAAVPGSKATTKPTVVPKPAAPDGIPPDIVAVITAAVASFHSQPYRIISIKPMSTGKTRLGIIPSSSRTVSANQTTAMDHLRITVEGKIYDVTVESIGNESSSSLAAPAPVVRSVAPAPVNAAAPAPKPSATEGSAGAAPSPLAGIVQAIDAAVGSSVAEGDLVITLEAMKMYTPINAPMSGTITAIHVQVGDAVEEGQILYTIG
jgi:biotin carboxyl carrier protein/Na+-transporting methylmalonyl-CoA/oxaloacetate decarboxylase gamma subunit